jgi:hypothetical protein
MIESLGIAGEVKGYDNVLRADDLSAQTRQDIKDARENAWDSMLPWTTIMALGAAGGAGALVVSVRSKEKDDTESVAAEANTTD